MRLRRRRLAPVPSPCFVSHSYGDPVLELALRALPYGVDSIVFPPITVDPSDYVSSHLLDSIAQANSALVLDNTRARPSIWVAFEKYFAAQRGLPIFSYDSKTHRIFKSTFALPSLNVILEAQPNDGKWVRPIVDYLLIERGFRVWISYDPFVPNESDRWSKAFYKTGQIGAYIHFRHSSEVDLEKVQSAAQFFDDSFILCTPDCERTDLSELFGKSYISLANDEGDAISNNRIDDLMVMSVAIALRNIQPSLYRPSTRQKV